MNADERRCKSGAVSSAFIRVHLRFVLLGIAMVGCAADSQPTTRPMTARERQEAALSDPFGYSPYEDSAEYDISGGKLNELDRKALKKDIDHVLNP